MTRIPVVWDEDCLLHEPDGEVWLGVWEAGTEVPARATVLLEALKAAEAEIVPAAPHDDSAILAVHDAALVDHLKTVWDEWEKADYDRPRVVPYVFPTAGLLAGLPLSSPSAIHGRTGRFCYDTMTLIGPGTWRAARAAADAALTAADLVSAGAEVAYALTRPPGHHASRTGYGGSCYLNNAAIAAQALRAEGASAWPSSTWTPTMATAPRRSSTTAPTFMSAASTSIPERAGSRTTSGTPTSAE